MLNKLGVILLSLCCFCAIADLTEEPMKIEVDWPFLANLAFKKLDHIQLYAHHGRIVGHIVISRDALSEEILQDYLIACDLDIVYV